MKTNHDSDDNDNDNDDNDNNNEYIRKYRDLFLAVNDESSSIRIIFMSKLNESLIVKLVQKLSFPQVLSLFHFKLNLYMIAYL